MKNLRQLILFGFIIFHNTLSAGSSHCEQPPSGPPGIPGNPGINGSTSFGSFYNTTITTIPVNASLPFPITAAQNNITHPNATDFVIQTDGYYYFYFGAAYSILSDLDSSTILALFVNGTEVQGTQLGITFPSVVDVTLNNLSTIIPLHAGDVVTVRNTLNIMNLSVGSNGPVNAFINLIRLAPL